MLRIRWTASTGFTGRHAPDSLDAFDRITHSLNPQIPESRKVTILRLVRDSKLSRELKEKYNNKCQLCGKQLRGADGKFMSEAHHIRPYNKSHKGSDTKSNLIVLCPNHHAQFDQLFYALEPQTHKVHCLFNNDDYHLMSLEMEDRHTLGEKYLNYIWDLFCNKKKCI